MHGIGTQGNSLIEGWVTKYKVAISLDGINFNVLKANSTALVNSEQFVKNWEKIFLNDNDFDV